MSEELVPSGPNPGSPFDAIRRVDERGEFWSGRELMPLLDYDRWERFTDAVERAKISCVNFQCNPAEHFDFDYFATPRNNPGQSNKGRGRPREDVRLTRYGCYLVAMNGDVRKPAVSGAQAYFAIRTHQAEQLLAARAGERPPSPWSDRLIRTLADHKAAVGLRYPGHWTVIIATASDALVLEQVLHEHGLPTCGGDLPDGSVGGRWARAVKDQGLPAAVGAAPLLLPARGYVVDVKVYPPAAFLEFVDWYQREYARKGLVEYLTNKETLRPFAPIVRKSAADRTCRAITGRTAELKDDDRKALVRAGGRVRVGEEVRALPPPPPLQPPPGLF